MDSNLRNVIAEAIEGPDNSFWHVLELVSLIDGVSTYHLTVRDDIIEFSGPDALARAGAKLEELHYRALADAVMTVLPTEHR